MVKKKVIKENPHLPKEARVAIEKLITYKCQYCKDTGKDIYGITPCSECGKKV